MKNKTEIILLVDRSGSMSTIKADMEGGFKTFLEAQKALPGEATVTYYQFDTVLDKVFETLPLKDVNSITIDPRGGTALVDAACEVIDKVGQRLAKTPELDRPTSVVFVIITDGEENSSRKFVAKDLKDRITHQQDKYNWKFVFLGSNIDAISVSANYGISKDSTLEFASNAKGIQASIGTLTRSMACYRAGGDYQVSDEERLEASGKE
jgi:hypothetical protein